jgi:hypothetical protein
MDMEGLTEDFKKAVTDVLIGILVGFILTIFKENILSMPNGSTWVALIELMPILFFLRDVEIIQYISYSSALGYFLTIFTIGKTFMPEWEIGLNIILLIIYIVKKIFG